ncbi:hypothetical protein TGAM01_v204090 [Trichoderma gamsii]|uniref:Nephrocystin 3-like N-terminal domain-containing protein n=1 Tax=Trichoderma gamsii TaxID=398673 RepID=A0A2P4ZSA0_9HYPO|nr:hypothetical protein TGAM01_v204090 [Trichoderma gamsii]PON27141.1 hypothetical protein TGAM01_v204090 [Trichoderma gamsii]
MRYRSFLSWLRSILLYSFSSYAHLPFSRIYGVIMDVLGLFSNISQVVDLLIKIGVMCSIYCFDVKNAPKEVRLLLREVDRLTVVIKELEILLNGSKGATKIESPVLRQTVFDLRKLLAELVAKLDLGAKNTSTRAMWPFKKREVYDIIATIDRQKANILLNMSIEQTSILIDVHQEFVLSKLRVAEAATFDSSVDGEQSYCLPGTRTEVIAQIRQWSTEQNGQSIFWLNGMAGTGKSTISRTVAQLSSNNDVLGASFFFKRGEGNRGRATFLFTTIAAQLVRRLPCLAPHIREVLVIDPFIHEKPLNDQFQKLILDPLSKNPRCWGPNLLIAIDALDECGSEDDMRTMISVFSKAQETTSPRVKFFLTSRPELPIRLGFENIGGKYDNLLLASVPATTITLDIGLFMRNKLQAIKKDYNMSVSEHRKIRPDWPGEDVLQKLIVTAIPLFIAAATICRFLSDRRLGSPHHQLNRLLEYQTIKISGMDMTYLPVLDRLIAGLSPSRKQEVLHRFRYLIGSIVTLARPLSIRSLSRLLDITTDIIEDQLDLLHSVLSVPTDLDTPVRLLHLSFRDFLVDAEEAHSKNDFWSQKVESHGSAVLEVVLSPDKKRVVTTAGERTVKLWDTASGKCITTGERHKILAPVPLVVPHDILSAPYDHVMDRNDLYGWPRSIQFSQDSSKFVSIDETFGPKLWNTNNGGYEPLHETNHGSTISIADSPSDMAVSFTSREDTVKYWDIVSKTLLGSFGDKTHELSYSTFSPDGTYLMLGYEDGAVRLYHLPTEKWKDMKATHEGPVTLITMSADGTRLASGTGKIQIYDTKSGTCTVKYETACPTSNINQILFSPDSRYLTILYSAKKDSDYARNEKLSLLDASTGDCIATLGMCGLANHIEFDSAKSNLLITNVGTFLFNPPTFPNAKPIGLGLSNDGEWITWDSRNLLWLPPTFRISASDIDVGASLIALGTRLGRLILIGIDSSKVPPPTVTVNLLDATNVP